MASTSKPTRRVLHVLQALAVEPDGLTLTEVATQVAIPPATCSAILAGLVDERVVDRSPDKRYTFRAGAFGSVADQPPRVRVLAAADAVLRELAEVTACKVMLTRMAPEGLSAVGIWDAAHTPVRLDHYLGPFVPPFGITAVAWMSRTRVSSWLAAGEFDTDAAAHYRRLLASVRRDHVIGFATPGDGGPTMRDLAEFLEAAMGAGPVRFNPPDRALIDIAARFEGLAGPVFKSSRRLAVSHLVAPVFGAHGVPIFEVELLVLAGDTTRPRRLRLAAALRNSAHALALQSGGAIP
ncbi:MAG: helix-turn-helix domain-containing protein [Acidimicrobiales bacterium]|nr:helix-turn-helix domain-containing protein [Acidimicrobiales bacterium]